MQRRDPRPIQDFDDLVDELLLTGRKLAYLVLPLQPGVHSCLNGGRVERPELLDDSTKLASPQEHRVVFEIVDSHGAGAVPVAH